MNWFELSDERKRLLLDQASARLQASPNAIEKDWWVTIVLKAVFNTAYAEEIIFKGGTSLSKSWQLIKRFSEDIDLAINRRVLGFGEQLTITQNKLLKRAGAEFTSTVFKDAIERELYELGVPKEAISIYAKPARPDFPEVDPQELFVEYVSVLGQDAYLLPSVKIEMSVRSLTEPHFRRNISSLIDEAIPGQNYSDEPFTVRAIDPRITILEKIFLLHEEFTKPADRIRTERMSRHLHDLERTMESACCNNAINDGELYLKICAHRKQMIRQKHVNYDHHAQSTIQFIPPVEWMSVYKADYEKMKLSMFRGEVPGFEEVIFKLNMLQAWIRNGGKE
ncbi:MAG: nucleotidyl transferase AbiEii/AbiGii toxin family protein [Sediminibacterium sp.]|nr:nucleotidyl transferase AbiEii/AbiGii toxin family protein [Sediminibacterium sp.]